MLRSVVRQSIRTLLTRCLPASQWLVHGPASANGRPALALTFDDGPHPEHTAAVLDALRRWDQHATFFVIGAQAALHPDIVRQIAASGHQVANHTWTHSEPRQTGARTFLDETRRTREFLQELTDQPVRWMRPPKGELSFGKLVGLWRMRQPVALWNVDCRDFRMTTSADVSEWCASYQPADGDIVLLHDRVPFAAQIVDELGARGVFERFSSVTLDEWLTPAASRAKVSVAALPPESVAPVR